jgi:sugar phosphate isomerase/epimerase
MNRRQFLAGAGTGAGLAARCWAARSAGKAEAAGRRARIAVSSYPWYHQFASTRGKSAPAPAKPLEFLDFPELVADRFHLHNLEILSPHFESRSPAYIKEVNLRLKRAHSHIVNMPIDVRELWNQEGLSAADPKERERAIALYQPWFDFARAVGARSVRCDPGKINRDDLAPTIASYRALAAYAKSKGLWVVVENHFGVGSEYPEQLVRILKQVGGQAATLPDFGNFPDQATRERGLKLLFPLARTICHARDTEGDGKGHLLHFDLALCVRIAREAGYRGMYSVEAEAEGDINANVQHVYDLLMESI